MKTYFLDSPHYMLSDTIPASVLSIGNFDGVHLGHQLMLKQLKQTASMHNLSTMVMIFEPQPREYFAILNGQPESAPARLSCLNEKLTLFRQLDIDIVVVATFDEAFRSLDATAFADLLADNLNVKSLVLGDDFRFGHDRTGDSSFLREYGLAVTNLQTITDTDQLATQVMLDSDSAKLIKSDIRISSTRIRELLLLGDLTTANRLLGYDYSITGNVVAGDQIGRTLNFPTANIELNRIRPALRGVYAVDVVILDTVGDPSANAFSEAAQLASANQAIDSTITSTELNTSSQARMGIVGLRPHSLFGTANIGVRPSVDKPLDWRLEVFFPEFAGDLYDKTLNVRLLHFLHDERNYNGLDALKAGIQQDVDDLVKWRAIQ